MNSLLLENYHWLLKGNSWDDLVPSEYIIHGGV